MGVSVRLSRNARLYLPFWIAIPVYLFVAAAYVAVFTLYGLGWLIYHGSVAIAEVVSESRKNRQLRQAGLYPPTQSAPRVSAAMATWTGPVTNVRRAGSTLIFELNDPAGSQQPTATGRLAELAYGTVTGSLSSVYAPLAELRDGDVIEMTVTEAGPDVANARIVRRGPHA